MRAGDRRLRSPVAWALVLAVALGSAQAADPPRAAAERGAVLDGAEAYALVADLISDRPRARRRAAGRLIEARDETVVPAIVDGLFFVPTKDRGLLLNVLEALTGEQRGRRYLDWVEYVGSRTDLAPKPGYVAWKASLLGRIDPRLGGPGGLIREGVSARIRLEEVVWGGVRFEGIPALDRPTHVAAAEAEYLRDDEVVYGVSAGGEHRAYPDRILSWHEMTNDVVGGEPVTLSYCTLCGTAVLYSGRLGSGQGDGGTARTLTFGTSGLLYRSNKLMVDRDTGTLWSNVTGEAVVGRLAGADPAPTLELLPVTVTTWGEWRVRHPETTVLALDEARARRWGFDYRPGAADSARRGVDFPVWLASDRLDAREEIFALRLGGRAKAYPLARLAAAGVVNDTVGGEPVVLVSDPASGAVRAYRRGERSFRRGGGGDLVDGAGTLWRLSEEALLPPYDAGVDALPRVPGHNAFWFGWFGFYPDTEVYEPEGASLPTVPTAERPA